MTPQEIKVLAPSVFSTKPSPLMSNRYTFLPTFELIEKFEREGWGVSKASQIGKGNYGRHEVRMRNHNIPNVGDSLVEAIISNSHNGMSSFKIHTGLYRLVCSNGLTVPTSVIDNISIRHSNLELGEIRRITDEFAERLPIIQRSVSKMENTFLNDEQTIELLDKSLSLRWKKEYAPLKINLDEILVPEREADMGNSVWKTFNVIQEKFVRGGIHYNSKKGRSMTSKTIKNFENINKINTGLWELAESYC